MSGRPPVIRIELVDPDGDARGIWVTISPLRDLDARSAIMAAGEAAALFIASLAVDSETVERRLRKT